MSVKDKNQLPAASEQRTYPEVRRRIKVLRNTRRLVATSLITLAAGSQTAEAATAHSSNVVPSAHIAEMPSKPGLKKVEQLPGYNLRVTPEQRREQRAAVVQIVTQPEYGAAGVNKGGPTPWSESCTGYRVRTSGTSSVPYIITSAHCFESATGSRNGIFSDLLAPQNKAENFINVGNMQYSVTTPNTFTNSPFTNSIFPLDSISVDTHNKDVALIRMLPPAPGMGDSNASHEKNYSDIPAIPASKFTGEPVPGEEVSLLGTSQADGDVLQAGTGRYLGRVELGSHDSQGNSVNRKLDIVGIKANIPAADVCNFGDSGSVAQYATGSYTGPLSLRYNFSYGSGKNKVWQQEDYDARTTEKLSVKTIEEETGVSAEGFTTLCAYTVMGSNTIPSLVTGFNVSAAPDFVK